MEEVGIDARLKEFELQKSIAYTAGLLQGDITIKRLLESIAEGVVIINEFGRIILINQRLAAMSDYSKQEVMGMELSIFMNPEMKQQHQQHIQHFFSSPRVRPMGVGLEISLFRKNGTAFPVEISVSFLETDAGRLGIGFITDHSETKKAMDALTRRNIELDAYAHTIAHDLRSSLSGIAGFSKILLEDDGEMDEAERKKYIEIIARGSQKMNTVIREMLLFASIDKADIHLSKLQMKQVVVEATSRLRYQVEQKGATISVSDDMQDCVSYGPWVEEIWYNFISNAIKYGGESPQILIHSTQLDNGFIQYSVIDNGLGMSKEKVATLFDEANAPRFSQRKVSGLGLSIVRRIVEKLDGSLSVDAKEGEGSIFSFYLKA